MLATDTDIQRPQSWRRGALVCVAVVVLNAALTFQNVWPTLAVYWQGELSVELAVLLLLLAVSNAWLGPTPPRWLAVLSGLTVIFALGRYAAVTAPALYGREVNLYWDAPQLASVIGMLVRVASTWSVVAICAGACMVLAGLYVVFRWALGHIDAALRFHRAARVSFALGGGVLVGYFLVQQFTDGAPFLPRFSIPVAKIYSEQLVRLTDAVLSSRTARVLPPTPPLQSSFAALAGQDVLIVFMESYGRVTYARPEFVEALKPVRARLAAAVQDTQRDVVSAYVSSPTFGGDSVLAHLSLLSGIEVRDSNRYVLLMTQQRPTLVSVFKAHGYRTVDVMPGMRQSWPEGAFYGFDEIYDAKKLDYHGPEFGWWRIPDQFSLAALDSEELQRRARSPLFVFFPTVSTHMPFAPIPPLQSDGYRVLTAQPFDTEPLQRALAQEPDWTHMGNSYVSSVEYFLDVVANYLRERPYANFVLIILGDHQPAANVSGENASWDVPVHVIGRPSAVLDSLLKRGFRSGLAPAERTLGKMHELGPWLLAAFGNSRMVDCRVRQECKASQQP